MDDARGRSRGRGVTPESGGTACNSTAVIKQEAKLYDDIAKRFTADAAKTGDKLRGW